MTKLLNIKSFVLNDTENIMYNNYMTKQQRKRLSSIFLILGMAFLAIGFATDQTLFTWIAIAFVLVSLVSGGKWLRPRK
jgi:hypothetical protein